VEEEGMESAKGVEDEQIAQAGEGETIGLLSPEPERGAYGKGGSSDEDLELDELGRVGEDGKEDADEHGPMDVAITLASTGR
jgi:hypothetical protein